MRGAGLELSCLSYFIQLFLEFQTSRQENSRAGRGERTSCVIFDFLTIYHCFTTSFNALLTARRWMLLRNERDMARKVHLESFVDKSK